MTTRELYEMASMDALGLLDDEERQAFESAFRAAPPHIQAEIRREQLREAQATDHLPQVEPPATLRARVIAAVMDTVETLQTEPVAAIGPSGRLGSGSAAFWRAACIGFATATVVLAGFVYTVADQNKIISQEALDADVIGDFNDINGGFSEYFSGANTQFIAFRTGESVAQSGVGVVPFARASYDPDQEKMLLTCFNLPIAPSDYSFVAYPTSGDPIYKSFKVTKPISGLEIKSIDISEFEKFEIHSPSRNGTSEVLLESGDV